MKYYFYDELGNVNLIYYVLPPEELLKNNYIKSDKIFENKDGFEITFKVNLITKELIAEYIPLPPKSENEIDILKKEMTSLKEQMAALQQTIISKKIAR